MVISSGIESWLQPFGLQASHYVSPLLHNTAPWPLWTTTPIHKYVDTAKYNMPMTICLDTRIQVRHGMIRYGLCPIDIWLKEKTALGKYGIGKESTVVKIISAVTNIFKVWQPLYLTTGMYRCVRSWCVSSRCMQYGSIRSLDSGKTAVCYPKRIRYVVWYRQRPAGVSRRQRPLVSWKIVPGGKAGHDTLRVCSE